MIKENVPLGRFGKPEEVGDLVVYLSSEQHLLLTVQLLELMVDKL